MKDIDLATLQRAEPRILTQKSGRVAYSLGYDGVYYHSRYGHQVENWALFENKGFPIQNAKSEAISADDPDLLLAMQILGLEFVD